MHLLGKRPTFRQQKARSDPYRMVLWIGLIIIGLFILRAINQKQIISPFLPTPIPTRVSSSFALEGETRFIAGDINGAIEAYQGAVALDPNNVELWSELARIQAYSSSLLSTDKLRSQRLAEALESIDKAVEIGSDDSMAHAIRAFVLDWNANPIYVGDKWENLLTEAGQEAVRARQLDNKNTLALAYYAEILVDQQLLLQAEQTINVALEQDTSLMDVHRVDGYVKESLGYYGDAIRSYQKAVEISPNLTFLYVQIGINYRQLKQYDMALEYFDKAAQINDQIGVTDPMPYLAIGKTYSQMGEFFIAAKNVEKVLQYDPTNPEIYATLGMIYFKSRNYEGAIPALKCATYGCNADESCLVRMGDAEICETDDQINNPIEIEGMPLTSSTVVYYYSYGSVLAGMHRPYNDYCKEAVQVLQDVRDSFASDPTIIQIVEESEEVCTSFGITQ